MSACRDLIGKRFNRLTVIERLENDKHKKAKWLCICDCGNTVVTNSGDLTRGHTKSCGCFKIEQNTKHNMYKSRIYGIWHNMKDRCTREKSAYYKLYGARGITICEEWKNDFTAFYNWSMENGYKDDLTIDRIDVNGNYEPSNCRWITHKEQQNNKQYNRLITYDNKTLTISQWCDELGFKYSCLRHRLDRGWSIERALTTPVKNKKEQ